MSNRYDVIALSSESTVVAEYLPDQRTDTACQSESALERELIAHVERFVGLSPSAD